MKANGDEKIYWKCVKQGNKNEAKCLGRCHSIGLHEPVSETTAHNHAENVDNEDALRAIDQMLDQAATSSAAPRDIIRDVQFTISLASAIELPSQANLTQRIKRRKKTGN